MQHLSESPPAALPRAPYGQPFAVRLREFVDALRDELEEMSLELLTAELRHAADSGLAWFLSVRRAGGGLELLRAKVDESAELDGDARAELRERIAKYFAVE